MIPFRLSSLQCGQGGRLQRFWKGAAFPHADLNPVAHLLTTE